MALNSSHVAVHYNAGFIVLSYLVSLVGCITTLELLQRRTSRRGLYNWYLLVASCICMGGIGIWSMHFIGNRAIVLNDGNAGSQILYSGGFTAASFFLPIVVLLVAFYLLGVVDRGNWYYIAASGLLTGTAVCGMHYVGQLGISNYNIGYHEQNVVGAAIISVVASFIALSVFFKLRDTWTDSWWKRSLCAAVLAGAVSGMHWTAAVGTVYHYRGTLKAPSTRSREQTVIVCAVLVSISRLQFDHG
jgi:NO-binding membrane sensor protein with MHYT domain